MYNFLAGLALGWLAGSWYSKRGSARVPLAEVRRRASSALEESGRIVEASKRELQAAVQGGNAGGDASEGRPRHQRRQSRRRPKGEGPSENV